MGYSRCFTIQSILQLDNNDYIILYNPIIYRMIIAVLQSKLHVSLLIIESYNSETCNIDCNPLIVISII